MAVANCNLTGMILQAGGPKMDEEIRWGEKRSASTRSTWDTLPKCSDLPVFSCKISERDDGSSTVWTNIAPLPKRQKTPEFAFYICEFALYQYDNCYFTYDSEFWFVIPQILGLLYLPSYGSSDDTGALFPGYGASLCVISWVWPSHRMPVSSRITPLKTNMTLEHGHVQ